MPKINRKYLHSNVFHIMVQGINKEYIFERNKEKQKYRKLIKEELKNYSIEIIAYCIMNNHVHLLVKIKKVEDMSKFMHQINMLYALEYNKSMNRVGYVFRSRFKSEPITTEKYLINCINYINNNPVKAKICKEKYEYSYSGYNDNEIINKKWKKLYDIKTREELYFIDIEETKENEINEEIDKVLRLKNIKREELKSNKEALELVLLKLQKMNISIRKMEKIFKIDKKKIKKILTC